MINVNPLMSTNLYLIVLLKIHLGTLIFIQSVFDAIVHIQLWLESVDAYGRVSILLIKFGTVANSQLQVTVCQIEPKWKGLLTI